MSFSSNSQAALPLLIIGGGIGGLSVAYALAIKGYNSIILEQASELRTAGYGIQLSPNVFKMFDRLRILEQIKQVTLFPNHAILNDGSTGKEFMRFVLGKEIEKRFKYPYGVFHREDLLGVLIDACKKTSKVEIITSTKIIDYKELDDCVEAVSEKGEVFKGSCLIGADGLWSNMRQKITDLPLKFTGNIAFRGLTSKEKIPQRFHTNDIYFWMLPGAHIVLYPLRNGTMYNVFMAIQHKNNLADYIPNSCEDAKEIINHLNQDRRWELYDCEPVSHWTKGKAVLIGDAVHPTLPYLAQGAGLTIEDAVVLAEKIDTHKSDFPKAFKAYQDERHLRAARAQLTARFNESIDHSSGELRELRNAFFAKQSPEDNYNLFAWLWEGI